MPVNRSRTDGTLPLWAGRTAALIGILFVALNLRTSVAALSPILGDISADIPLSALVIGIIGAAPPLIFAASGILAPPIARRLSLEGSLLAAVAAMILGDLARALAPNSGVLVTGTVVLLIGVGVTNILLPPLVKRYFPARVGLVTTLYVTLISVGTALPALAAVPVSEATTWRISLLVWLVLVAPAALPWGILLARHLRAVRAKRESADEAVEEPAGQIVGKLWRSPTAWAISVAFAISSLNAYAAFAWLPSLLVATAEVTPAQAGALLSLYAIMGFPSALAIPVLAARMRNVGILVFVGVGFLVLGYAGLLLAPAAVPVLWVILIGLGPILFPLALVLINSRTRTHPGSIALSGFVQGVGYTLGALGPLVVGSLHESTGGWTVPIVFLLVVSVAGLACGFRLLRPRFVEDEL